MESNLIYDESRLELNIKFEEFFKRVEVKILETYPDIESRFGTAGIERTKEDIRFHLNYLKTSIELNDKDIFLDYISWVKMYFNSIHLPLEYQKPPLEYIKDVSKEIFSPGTSKTICEYINYSLQRFDNLPLEMNSFLSSDNKLNVLAQQYLNSLLRRDRMSAERLIDESIKDGTHIKEIYLNVFQPVQWELGRLWQHNKLSVAMEHYCTAATQFIMSRLYEYIFSTHKTEKHLVATSVSGELHELGIRMVSDFFELGGWHTYYLGSNTPDSGIVDMIKDTNADALAISATIPYNLKHVAELINTVRTEIPNGKLKILVGGNAFKNDPELWRKLNADGYARDANEAVEKANYLITN